MYHKVQHNIIAVPMYLIISLYKIVVLHYNFRIILKSNIKILCKVNLKYICKTIFDLYIIYSIKLKIILGREYTYNIVSTPVLILA